MQTLSSLLPDELYQSYIIEGDSESLVQELQQALYARGDSVPASSDMLCQTYDAFTIADSALIKEWHVNKGLGTHKRICIIGAKFINYEAQQSLLKILEEPGENTHFFIVVPQSDLLLPTIRSRTHTLHLHTHIDTDTARVFLKASPSERLVVIGKMIDENKDTDGSGALRHKATKLVNGLEQSMYETFKKNKDDMHARFILEELQKSREYLSTPGASVKMILEHLALVI